MPYDNLSREDDDDDERTLCESAAGDTESIRSSQSTLVPDSVTSRRRSLGARLLGRRHRASQSGEPSTPQTSNNPDVVGALVSTLRAFNDTSVALERLNAEYAAADAEEDRRQQVFTELAKLSRHRRTADAVSTAVGKQRRQRMEEGWSKNDCETVESRATTALTEAETAFTEAYNAALSEYGRVSGRLSATKYLTLENGAWDKSKSKEMHQKDIESLADSYYEPDEDIEPAP